MRTDPLREALEFAAVTLSSDWPERCQEIVRRARAALADPAPDAHTDDMPQLPEPFAYLMPNSTFHFLPRPDGDGMGVFTDKQVFAYGRICAATIRDLK